MVDSIVIDIHLCLLVLKQKLHNKQLSMSYSSHAVLSLLWQLVHALMLLCMMDNRKFQSRV